MKVKKFNLVKDRIPVSTSPIFILIRHAPRYDITPWDRSPDITTSAIQQLKTIAHKIPTKTLIITSSKKRNIQTATILAKGQPIAIHDQLRRPVMVKFCPCLFKHDFVDNIIDLVKDASSWSKLTLALTSDYGVKYVWERFIGENISKNEVDNLTGLYFEM